VIDEATRENRQVYDSFGVAERIRAIVAANN
jgi:hypothetical protein